MLSKTVFLLSLTILSAFLAGAFFLPGEVLAVSVCTTTANCPADQFCAVEPKTGDGQCVAKTYDFKTPDLRPGSYVILQDTNADGRRVDSRGIPALSRFEVEYYDPTHTVNDCFGGKALRISKNSPKTYWSPLRVESMRFCLTQTPYLKSPGQVFYDFYAKSPKWDNEFDPLDIITKGYVEYPQNPSNVNMGRLGITPQPTVNGTPVAGNVAYGIVPKPGEVGFYPDLTKWTVWGWDSPFNTINHWHSEFKRAERGDNILVRYVEDTYNNAGLRLSLTEDWEWGSNLPIYLRQIERRPITDADRSATGHCWNSPYSCDQTSSPQVTLVSEISKKYEFVPSQLNVDFVKQDGTLTKNLTIPGNSCYRLRFTTQANEPYFGFIQTRINGNSASDAVWNTHGYPYFVGGGDLIVKPAAWNDAVRDGRSYAFHMRTQASNENIDVARVLINTKQPNVDSTWSNVLTFTRDDSVSATWDCKLASDSVSVDSVPAPDLFLDIDNNNVVNNNDLKYALTRYGLTDNIHGVSTKINAVFLAALMKVI